MDAIPTAVRLTAYAGESEDFLRTPIAELAAQIAEGSLVVQIGKFFRLDEIVEAYRLMEDNKAGGKIVVLPYRKYFTKFRRGRAAAVFNSRLGLPSSAPAG